jgi:hypothetical protein
LERAWPRAKSTLYSKKLVCNPTTDFSDRLLGGPIKQALERLPRDLHRLYHKGLDQVAPKWLGKKHYDKLSPKQKKRKLKEALEYTKLFDKEHGTNLAEAMRKHGCK